MNTIYVYFLKLFSENNKQFIRFCVVGAVCTAIDAVLYYACLELMGYRLAMVSGFMVSLAVNYLLNLYWSFGTQPSLRNAIGFLAAHCFNLFVVRMFLMWLFISIVGLSEGMAYIPTLCISMVTNFLIIRFVIKRC